MAVAGEAVAPPPGIAGFVQSPAGRNVLLSLGIAAALGLIVAGWLWTQQPEYRVLFSNFSDRDGGAIVASLQQLNIPYKFAEGGGAILVPSNQVYDARLKLASQGLPKGGNVGFEIMENQKLGRVAIPGAGQLPARAGGRTGQFDSIAGRRAGSQGSPGLAQSVGLHARTAKADRLGATQSQPRPLAG